MHIGIVLRNFGGGGAQRAQLTLAGALIGKGHRVDLVPMQFNGHYRNIIPDGARLYRRRRRKSDRDILEYCRARGIDVQTLAFDPLAVVAARRRLRRCYPRIGLRWSEAGKAVGVARYVREATPQILISGGPGSDHACILAGELTDRRVPTVVSIRNNIRLGQSERTTAKYRALIARADSVVAVSNGIAAEAVEMFGLDPQRVHTIYNPKPLAEIRRMAEEAPPHPWFGDGGPPVILTVLRESPQKDWATLVAAFGRVRRDADARLAILGPLSDRFRAQISASARRLGVDGDIVFLGFDDNPFRYMRRAALFVLSSRFEGMPNVLIESLACGTPVVSTDAPYGPAELLENGRWGRLTPVGDADAMAQAILYSLAGDTLPADALRRRAEDFSAERAVAAYEALFESLIGQRGGNGIDSKGKSPP